MADRTMVITDFLTQDQINEAIKIYETAEPGTFARTLAEKIIEPNLAEINRKLGQENDARYLAYACEYVFNQMKVK